MPQQLLLEFDNSTKRVMLTRLGDLLAGLTFYPSDSLDGKNSISGANCYRVLQALHGWTANPKKDAPRPGWTDKPADKLAPDLSARVVRRAKAILTAATGFHTVDTEDFRLNGSPRQWQRICWPNVAEWIEALETAAQTTVPENRDHRAGAAVSPCRSGLVDRAAAACSTVPERHGLSYDEQDELITNSLTTASELVGESFSELRNRKAEHADSCLLGELHEPEGDCEESRTNGADRTNRERQGDPGTVLSRHQLASEHDNQDGLPMPTRTVDPREQAIISRLIALDVGSARATLRESLRIGYTIEAIEAILGWYESLILFDPETQERVIPYWPGSLVIRLRDEDARRAEPSQGKWGGRRAEWTALKARLDAKPAAGRVPDQLFARRSALVETLNRSQVIFCLEVLASGDGPDVPRAVKCLAWVESNWAEDLNLLIPPPAVFKFLMQFDVEQIMRGGN